MKYIKTPLLRGTGDPCAVLDHSGLEFCYCPGALRDSARRARAIVQAVNAYDGLLAQKAEMLAALRRAEQTIRNLGMGLTGDDRTIAMNEAWNLRAAIAKAEGKEGTE